MVQCCCLRCSYILHFLISSPAWGAKCSHSFNFVFLFSLVEIFFHFPLFHYHYKVNSAVHFGQKNWPLRQKKIWLTFKMTNYSSKWYLKSMKKQQRSWLLIFLHMLYCLHTKIILIQMMCTNIKNYVTQTSVNQYRTWIREVHFQLYAC